MEIMPGYDHSVPPSPPPQRSNKSLWIGLLVGVLVLCLLGVVTAIYYSGLDVPRLLSGIFPSPTPSALVYDNPAAGLRLTYPLDWQYSETGDPTYGFAVTFASSSDILAAPSKAIQGGALLMVGTLPLATSNLPFSVDAGSMGDAVNQLASLVFNQAGLGQDLRIFKLSGFPAASALFTVSTDDTTQTAAYLTAVLRSDGLVLFVGLCPQVEWFQYQPVFRSILDSVSLSRP